MPGQSKISPFSSRILGHRYEFERNPVSSYGYLVFGMGEKADDVPRKFISFHCLEKESNENKESNAEGAGNYPDLPQRNEMDFFMIEETGTSPTESLPVLQVTGAKEATAR